MEKNECPHVNFSTRKLIVFFLLIFLTTKVSGQISDYVSAVKVGDAKDKTALTISADLFSAENIAGINVVYKSFGQSEFKKVEMLIVGNSASSIIPAEDVEPPFLEYYLLIELKDGSTQTYPIGVEQGVSPLQISISGVSEKDKEILVLSPTDGELVSQENMLISISFVKAPGNIDISKTKVFLNNEDITSQALLAGDLIVINGEGLSTRAIGSHSLKVEVYDNDGNLYHTVSRTFQLVSAEVAAEIISRWKTAGNLRGGARNENYNSVTTGYYNISADANASYDQWRFNGYLYFTSEEKERLQPYNRYSAAIQGGDWLELKVGDSYPRFPNLIMDGKRIRGFSGQLNLGFLNIQTAFGQTIRKAEGRLIEQYSAANAPLGSDIIAINKTKYGFPFGKVSLGTYKRDLFAIRPSFGSGENFQLGFSYLHSKDDMGSIEFGARPQENAVFGTDLTIAFDGQNVLFTSQAAFSLVNRDISSGTLTDAEIDSVFGSGGFINVDTDQIKRLRDILGKIITVNQYIGPLNPQEFASLAAETALSLNYLNNSFKASYIYRGNDYYSYGQTFLRTDIKGFNIIDRIRMFDNKLFLSLGYESLEDNLQKTKIATTKFETLSASVSIFPRVDFPNITLGFNRYNNNNGLSIKDPNNKNFVVNDITNRFLIQLSYDFIAGIKHSSSFSFTTQNREDNSLSNTDAAFNSGSLTVNSYWSSQLTSLFQFIYSSSEISKVPFDYITLSVGAKYRMLGNKLLLSATLSPSFGDFERQAFEFLADYNLVGNLNLAFQTRIFRFPGKFTNSIIGLVTRFTF